MTTIFTSFEDIEKDLGQRAPKVVYKYRTWNDPYHKGLLLNQEAWFSHPFDLNDPLDVRPETEFDLNEINDARYLEKLRGQAKEIFPALTHQEQEAKAQEQWQMTKGNPKLIIENRTRQTQERKNYNQVGVFSTSSNELSSELWGKYGNAYKGYCLGFKTVEFCRSTKSGFGHVVYSDKPYQYSFLNKKDEFSPLFLKKTSWGYEAEFRFLTVGVDVEINGKVYTTRTQKFSVDVVSEIVLGHNLSKEDEEAILKVLSEKYPANLPVYKTHIDGLGVVSKVRLK